MPSKSVPDKKGPIVAGTPHEAHSLQQPAQLHQLTTPDAQIDGIVGGPVEGQFVTQAGGEDSPDPIQVSPPPGVIDRLERIKPEWVKRWHAHSSVTAIRLWIEPVNGCADPVKVAEFLQLAQDAIYPFPLRIQFAPSVTTPDGRMMQRVHSLIRSGPTSPNKPIKQRQRPSNDETTEEIKRTLPLEVTLLRPVYYRLNLPQGGLDFVVLRIHAPAHKEQHLSEWREKFEGERGISVFFSRIDGFRGIHHQLKALADSDGLIRERHIPLVRKCMENICGKAPTEEPLLTAPSTIRSRINLLHIPFVAMDGEHTADREDLIYSERLPNGNVRVLVAFIDVTDHVKVGSKRDRFAQRVGHTIYGSRHAFPTLGRALAYGPAHFALGEERPAWVVEMILDGTTGEKLDSTGGKLDTTGSDFEAKKPNVFRAMVKAHTYATPQQFSSTLSQDVESPQRERFVDLALAGALLHQARMKSDRLERIDGDSLGHEVLAEMMIAAKCQIGLYLHLSKVDAVWKVHAKPNEAGKRDLVRRVAALGIEAVPEDFDKPLAFATLVRRLEDLQSAEGRALAGQILAMFLLKSTFSTCNVGHFGMGEKFVVEIKPRDAAGLRTQQQLHALDGEAPIISEEMLSHFAIWRNSRKTREDEKRYEWRFYEMLLQKLGESGQLHHATVVADRADHVFVTVPGFKKWCFVPKFPNSGSPMPVGMSFFAVLDGFWAVNREDMRFRLSPLWSVEEDITEPTVEPEQQSAF